MVFNIMIIQCKQGLLFENNDCKELTEGMINGFKLWTPIIISHFKKKSF